MNVQMLKKWTGLIECLSVTLRLKEFIWVKNIALKHLIFRQKILEKDIKM
jgi:hypothetical protein